MNKTKFCGVLENIMYDDLLKTLEDILDKDKLKSKIRLFGEEITYADEKIDLYIHTENKSGSSSKTEGKDNFLLEGQFFGSIEEEKKYFSIWLKIFDSKSIPYSFEYYEEDEDGNMLADSDEVRHPHYGNKLG